MGSDQSALATALADLRQVEEAAKKNSKKAKKEGTPLFENGQWQEAVARFVNSVPLWAEVRGVGGVPPSRCHYYSFICAGGDGKAAVHI